MSHSIFDDHLVGKEIWLLNLCFINIYYVMISIQNVCSYYTVSHCNISQLMQRTKPFIYFVQQGDNVCDT